MTLTALVALVALLTGGVNLVYLLWPGLRADPGVEHWAQMEVLRMDKNVAWAEYAQRPGADRTRPAGAQSDETDGNVVYLQLEMHGFKGKPARLRWFTYNAENGARLDWPYASGRRFEAKAPTAKAVSEEWVPVPRQDGDFAVRFQLYDEDERLLAVADTPPFTSFSLPLDLEDG